MRANQNVTTFSPLKVSIFDRMMRDTPQVNRKLDSVIKKTPKPSQAKAPSQVQIKKEPPKQVLGTINKTMEKEKPEYKCVFSATKKGISCSPEGKFRSQGSPTHKCSEFPCEYYLSIVKGVKLSPKEALHESA